jgi:hypothetical protein
LFLSCVDFVRTDEDRGWNIKMLSCCCCCFFSLLQSEEGWREFEGLIVVNGVVECASEVCDWKEALTSSEQEHNKWAKYKTMNKLLLFFFLLCKKDLQGKPNLHHPTSPPKFHQSICYSNIWYMETRSECLTEITLEKSLKGMNVDKVNIWIPIELMALDWRHKWKKEN